MDNPHNEECTILYMQYKYLQAFSVLEFPDDSQMIGKKFDFHRALEICLAHWDSGWDCVYGRLTFYQDGEEVTFGH